ncbi:hypothetical protein AVEN_37143-1 [Araneus ventricosus]|uniref:Uncharacterized protein n=1 Tax=Araneus ventricosus TaxID=182803 RepID=A0A4Y2HB44_ARAVE|nr:hypothetical protein AVEN_37143-1 [Araneus ventricosus]
MNALSTLWSYPNDRPRGNAKEDFISITNRHLLNVKDPSNNVTLNGGWRPLTSQSCLAADISKSYLTYLQTHYGSNVAVVFDGYPSDVNGNSAKSAERIQQANLHLSHEIIFNEATCPETSQERFSANEINKMRFIDLLKKFLQKANVTVKQAVEDANVLIVETTVSVKFQYDNIFVVGEGIGILVLLTELAPMKENLYFQKCGKRRKPDVLYSTTSFKYKCSRMILLVHAFSGCDTSSALFGHGKTKFCFLEEKNRHLEEKIQVFFNSEATIDQVAKAGETFLIHLYGGNPRTSACDLNHLATRCLLNQQLKQGPF